MPGRTLDAIIMEALGIKEMTIQRLLWQIEDLKSQLAEARELIPHDDRAKGTE